MINLYGAVGDGVADDTTALQAALTAGASKTVYLGPGTYRTTAPLVVSGHGTKIEGGHAIIQFEGTGAALTSALVGTVYPQEVLLRQMAIYVTQPNAVALSARFTSSVFEELSIGLKPTATGSIGFDLVGDEANGTGPYYNAFRRCNVQGQGTSQTGVRFSNVAPGYRSANANTWVGGRVSQCAIGYDIAGAGNTFLNPTAEGCGVAFQFSRATECSVLGGYVESCATGASFSANALRNVVRQPLMTGVAMPLADATPANGNALGWGGADRLPFGIQLGNSTGILSHYSEGAWTPTLYGSTTPGDYTVEVADSARWTRIGRLVSVTAKLTATVNTVGAGIAVIGGLPFQKANGLHLAGAVYASKISLPFGATYVALTVQAMSVSGGSIFALAANRAGTTPYDVQITDFITSSQIAVNFTYQTDAA